MTCTVFVKFVSDPEYDPSKAVVGLACAAQAVSDGHDVDVFFAAAATRMLVPGYLEGLMERIGAPSAMAEQFVKVLSEGARWHCSFNSLKATAGIEEGQGGIIVPDEAMTWSGPPGVIGLATAAETVLCY
jgi:predicted peroxiredoxin